MATHIGELLRLAREERGIALREISNQTRISMRYLEAIEGNDYKRLPGGIFNRSFLKAYARYIGFDEAQALEGYAQYLSDQGQADDDILTPHYSKVYSGAGTRSPMMTVFLAILILVVLTVGALALAHWYKRRSASGSERRRPLAELAKESSQVSASVVMPRVVIFDRPGGNYEGFLG